MFLKVQSVFGLNDPNSFSMLEKEDSLKQDGLSFATLLALY